VGHTSRYVHLFRPYTLPSLLTDSTTAGADTTWKVGGGGNDGGSEADGGAAVSENDGFSPENVSKHAGNDNACYQ